MDYGKLLHIASEINKKNIKELEMSRKRAAKREAVKSAPSAKKICKTEPPSYKRKEKKGETTDKDDNVKDEQKSKAKVAKMQKYSANK